MKPIISYYGGKQRMAPKIVPLIPKHTVYVEPFCGGAAVFFKKPWPNVTNTHHYREVLNDKNGEIVNLYKCFQDAEKAERLIRRLQTTLYSREEHALRKEKDLDTVERAARFFCDIQMSFSNRLGAGWRTSVYGRNNAVTWANKVSALPEFLTRMASVHIENLDAIALIKKWDSPQTFFYCDPPYPGADQGHYAGYTQKDFENLCDALDSVQGSFILSCYDNPSVRDYWERFEFKANCTASGKNRTGENRDKSNASDSSERERIECVWRSFGSPVRSEIQKLFDSGAFDCFTGKPGERIKRLARSLSVPPPAGDIADRLEAELKKAGEG